MIRKILVASFCVFLTPALAGASTIDFTGLGKAQVVTIGGVRSITAWAGELNWTWLTGQPAGADTSFYTYCVDVLNNETDPQGVAVRSTNDMVTMATNGAQKAAWLFNTYAASIHATGTTTMAAGLQLAIWEVLYDNLNTITGKYELGSGNFTASNNAGATSAAGTYLWALTTASYMSSSATWLDSDNAANGGPTGHGPGQDQITRSVPEPATLLLLGTGLASMAAARRKKSQIGSPAV